MMNNEHLTGTTDEQRTAADSLPSASLEQNGVLGEERAEKTITDEQIDAYITRLVKENPVTFAQYALMIIAKDIAKSNATNFSLCQECDLEEGKRVEIEIKGTIKDVSRKDDMFKRNCEHCKTETMQAIVLYNPDNPDEGEVWQCSVCKENTDWVSE